MWKNYPIAQKTTTGDQKTKKVVFIRYNYYSCYTQQRLGKKHEVAKIDKEFKCEKKYPIAQKTTTAETKK